MAGSVDKKNEKRALTNGLKHDIMKFRGNCVTMSNRREEYGEKKEVLYLHAGLHSCSDEAAEKVDTTAYIWYNITQTSHIDFSYAP